MVVLRIVNFSHHHRIQKIEMKPTVTTMRRRKTGRRRPQEERKAFVTVMTFFHVCLLMMNFLSSRDIVLQSSSVWEVVPVVTPTHRQRHPATQKRFHTAALPSSSLTLWTFGGTLTRRTAAVYKFISFQVVEDQASYVLGSLPMAVSLSLKVRRRIALVLA
jgi:hypothetical protein